MNVQLTSYGIEVLSQTQKPLAITKYILGSASGYIPDEAATGIKGDSVFSSNPIGPTIINANVYQYSILLDYPVGPFTFGEVAFYDETDKCVAVGVAEKTIEKIATNNNSVGNSIRLDCYLSMVNGSYNTWGEYIGSNIGSQIPVVGNIDNLPPVHKSDPNFYIIAPFSQSMSAVLAYTAGTTGLWHFDCYSFANTRSFTILSATPTSVTVDISNLNAEQKQDMISTSYGDRIVEFSSGSCYSICRTVNSINLQTKKAIISFRTPLAITPNVGDTFLYMSRQPLSRVQVGVATKDQVGLVKPGEDLEVDLDGTLDLNFDPVKTINSIAPDENGNIVIDFNKVIEIEEDDLDMITETGLYQGDNSDGHIFNCPVNASFILEVRTSNLAVDQRLTANNLLRIRSYSAGNWGDWALVFGTNSPIRCGTF